MTNFLLSLIPLSVCGAAFEVARVANALERANRSERDKRRQS